MRKIKLLLAILTMSMLLGSTALAGTWVPSATGQWRYQNDDGSFATGWIADGGKDYYLDLNGIMLTDTTTPDGYYVGADGVWDGKEAKTTLSITTSTPTTVIGPGTYKVGTEIAAGEYVLLCNSTYSAYYAIKSDSTGDYGNIIANDNFNFNSIITVSDGQYLELKRCTLSPISEITQIDFTKGNMFKVGYHIPAGEYKLQTGDHSGYYAVLKNPNGEIGDIVTNDNFDGQTYVTVKNGQYLLLNRCSIIQ